MERRVFRHGSEGTESIFDTRAVVETSIKKVVFSVFKDQDKEIYSRLL